jgi:glutaminyl-peptide cyclotransferase
MMRIANFNNKNTKMSNLPQKTILILITLLTLSLSQCSTDTTKQFDPQRAYDDIKYQLSLGPRTAGSQAHKQVRSYISSELESAGWQVDEPEQELDGKSIYNIIGKRGNGDQWVIIGAHYDSRMFADRDPDQSLRNQAVPGANDGASGVAVLLELGRTLSKNLNMTIWLVYFDAEDNGTIPGYDWIMGSQVFVQNLENKPDKVIIIDMIGDKDLTIYQELNSDQSLTASIWSVANELGYNQFKPAPKNRILDDHVPFIDAGIPAVDIIDIDYPYWHTTQDTLDKVSAQSLKAVGETLTNYLDQLERETSK